MTAWRKGLLPLTPLYWLALAVRELRLQRGWEPVERLQAPVVSVGNLSTGGSGKTPLTIALARALTRRRVQVDVLSRGYRREGKLATQVDLRGIADEFGDEPILIARAAGVPVYVAARRFDAGRLAEGAAGKRGNWPLNQEDHPSGAKAPIDSTDFAARLNSCPDASSLLSAACEGSARQSCADTSSLLSGGCETPTHESCPDTRQSFSAACLAPAGLISWPSQGVHLLDDGFQHRQLFRDVDILLLNREDWQDGLLPAGNLREPLEAIHRAGVVAIPADDLGLERELRAGGWKGPVWRLRRTMEIPPVSGPVAAFCGIARPEQFFAGLEAAGLRLTAKAAFRDHHGYTKADLDRLLADARAAGAIALMTTEKDEVRLGVLASNLTETMPLLTARLTVSIEREDEAIDWLLDELKRAITHPAL